MLQMLTLHIDEVQERRRNKGWTRPTAQAAGSKAREVETGQKHFVRAIYSINIHM